VLDTLGRAGLTTGREDTATGASSTLLCSVCLRRASIIEGHHSGNQDQLLRGSCSDCFYERLCSRKRFNSRQREMLRAVSSASKILATIHQAETYAAANGYQPHGKDVNRCWECGGESRPQSRGCAALAISTKDREVCMDCAIRLALYSKVCTRCKTHSDRRKPPGGSCTSIYELGIRVCGACLTQMAIERLAPWAVQATQAK
jgi:hypothetical protein